MTDRLLCKILGELKDIKRMLMKNNIENVTIKDVINILNDPYDDIDCSNIVHELYKNYKCLLDEELSLELHKKAIENRHYNVIDTLYRLQCNELTQRKFPTLIENIIIEMDDSDMFDYLTKKFNITNYGLYYDKLSEYDSLNIFISLEHKLGRQDVLYKNAGIYNKPLIYYVLDTKCIDIMRHVCSMLNAYGKFVDINGQLDLNYRVILHLFLNDPEILTENMISNKFLSKINEYYVRVLTIDKINEILLKTNFLEYDPKWKRFSKKLKNDE